MRKFTLIEVITQKWKPVVVAALAWALSTTSVQAQTYSMSEKVSVHLKTTTALAVIETLDQQSNFRFSYSQAALKAITVDAFDCKDLPLDQALRILKEKTGLEYQVEGSIISIKKTIPVTSSKKAVGKITGRIADEENGQPVTGATIRIGNKGITAGIDGSYTISLPAGSYTAIASYVGYGSKEVSEVVIKEDREFILDITLKRGKGSLAGVVVKSSVKRESVAALYTRQKNAAAITDGISAEQISRTPDKNIGETLKRISGLSTIDNKYVVVRGLSERYNQAVLNGQVMPSTELNRKNFSFDIIPTNIVENVTIVKTLTPDRSAEFGGGLVEVNTLDIPAANFLNVNVGGSYNDNTTGKDFLAVKRERKEYFGRVASHRELLGSLDWKNTEDIIAKQAAGGTSDFLSNNWALYKLKAAPSHNYQVSGGHVKSIKGGAEWGMVGSLGYRNTVATQDILMSRDGYYGLDRSDGQGYARFKGKRYGLTNSLSGIMGIGYKDSRNHIGFQTMFLQTLDKQLLVGTGVNGDLGGVYELGYYDLTSQTSLWHNLLKGEHSLGKHGIKFKWSGGYMKLNRLKPDNHQLASTFVKTDSSSANEYSIGGARSSGIDRGALRWWSRALENNYSWDAAVSIPAQLRLGKLVINNTFKAGYNGWAKDRLFYVLNIGTGFQNFGGYYQPLGEAFTTENTVSSGISRFGDDFHRTAQLHAGYGMLDTKIGNKLRLVGGVRGEYYDLNGTNAVLDSTFIQINKSRGPNEKYDYSELISREPNWHLFPSVNLTYSLTSKMNLRLAYAKSIIRPDLRDLSNFREYDFELGGIYQSQLVRSTDAKHYDFRYEWYPGVGEVISFSLFYKQFDYPMEIYADEGSGNVFELRNNKKARNYGLEVELRKSMAFTKVPVLRNFTFYGNFTTLRSYVTPMEIKYNSLDPTNALKITPVEVMGKEERRPQTGASNYIVNAGVYYDTKPASLSLAYNYISNRTLRPDNAPQNSLFERPLASLDAQLAVRFLKKRGEIKLNISNLLNGAALVYKNRYDDDPAITGHLKEPSTKQLLYKEGLDAIDYQAKPGRTFSTTISYKF